MINPNAILEINSKNLISNYIAIQNYSKKKLTGAVIKANAYGLGDINIYKKLYKVGCRNFFLATLNEALNLRKKYLSSNIYVLNGLENNKITKFYDNNIIPILSSIEELELYINSKYFNENYKIGLHIDTGLNRLGIQIHQLIKKDLKKIKLFILMSHFSSAEELSNKYNYIQNKRFISTLNLFKSIKYISLSNSAGILNNESFHYNLTRPGIILYGGYQNQRLKRILKIKHVVKLKAKILQIKQIGINEYIGYNQTYKTSKKIIIAILGIGYADGIFRILSNKGKVYYKNQSFKIIGRISMDTMTIDITNCKHKIIIGDYMEIINKDNDIEKIARECKTISREILTSISQRVLRQYI